MDYIDELSKKSIFKDMEKLSFDYVPKELPHRIEEWLGVAIIIPKV